MLNFKKHIIYINRGNLVNYILHLLFFHNGHDIRTKGVFDKAGSLKKKDFLKNIGHKY